MDPLLRVSLHVATCRAKSAVFARLVRRPVANEWLSGVLVVDTEHAARRWGQTWSSAWPRQDVDAIAALYAGDAPYRALAFRAPDTPTGYLQRVFAEESDITCRFGEPVVSGNRAAVEWWGSWTEDGQTVTLAGVTMLRFDDDGKVVDHRDYWNQGEGRIEPYPDW